MTAEYTSSMLGRRLPHTVGLVFVGLLALVASALLTVGMRSIMTRGWDEPGDEQVLVALAAWTSATFIVAVASLVGAVVLAGATELARRAAADIGGAS